MDGSPLLATMAYRHRCAARHFFCCRHDCPLKKAHSGNARHSFSCYGKWNFGAHFDLNRLPDIAEFTSGCGSRLAAISVATTFFGGLTYIGNSPNLLIRTIAEIAPRAGAGIPHLYY
jgi:hypothetical protein